MRELDTSKYLYQFVGGEYNGELWHYAALEVRNMIAGYSDDLSALRARGVLCKREELDNQPLVDGYYPPMYGGRVYEVNGKYKFDFECTAEEQQGEPKHIIRYETAEVYEMLSQ